MAMNATLQRVQRFNIKVNATGGSLNPTSITVSEGTTSVPLDSIEDIPDVREIDVSSGSTIVYNADNDKYEVKPLDINYLSGNLDMGVF